MRSLDLFGSIARGDSGGNSDVDLLVEFDRPVGLFQFFRVQRRLEAIVGRPVDLVMKDAIKRQLRTRILAEAVSATSRTKHRSSIEHRSTLPLRHHSKRQKISRRDRSGSSDRTRKRAAQTAGK